MAHALRRTASRPDAGTPCARVHANALCGQCAARRLPPIVYRGLMLHAPFVGLPDPSSSLLSRAIRLLPCPHPAGVKKRRNGAPTNPGSRVQIDGATSSKKPLRRQEPVQPRQAAKTLHTAGVVSPTSLVNLASLRRGETDRNTDQTDQTPAVPQETDPPRRRCRT